MYACVCFAWPRLRVPYVGPGQVFDVALPASVRSVQIIRLVFEASTDFYGRVTVYELDVLGEASDAGA